MSPARHRRIAAQKRAKAKGLRMEADVLEAQALLDEEIALAKETLTKSERSGKVNASMQDVHRLNISKAIKPKDPFAEAVHKAGFASAADLARKLNFLPSLLSMYRKGHRPVPRDRAEAIQEATGWPATPKGWPGGLA